MRLDKFIASVTDYSRTDVKRSIKQHQVLVNHQVASNAAAHIDPNIDTVHFHGQALGTLAPRYFMLHKPQGTICATEDSEHPTVLDLIDEPNAHQLQIAGRLDKDTTGLVLLTDDGQWNHRITTPKKKCYKSYHVSLAEPLSAEAIQQLEHGIQLHHEKHPTLPAKVTLIKEKQIQLSIQEGKYHQVKRMLAAVNNHVIALHRLQIGDIVLDPTLDAGDYRALSATEINSIPQ